MNLVYGKGSPETGACWMSALHYYTRQDNSWTDDAPWACVSPLIRTFCISLNDKCESNDEREELIGPHLFDPVGTRGNNEDELKRAWIMLSAVISSVADRLVAGYHTGEMRIEHGTTLLSLGKEVNIYVPNYELVSEKISIPASFGGPREFTSFDQVSEYFTALLKQTPINRHQELMELFVQSYLDVAKRLTDHGESFSVEYFFSSDTHRKSNSLALDTLHGRIIIRDAIVKACKVGSKAEVTEACPRQQVLDMLEVGSVKSYEAACK